MSNKRKLVCKKCGGSHLTFKCGRKNNKSNPFTKVENKRKYNKKSFDNKFKTKYNNRNKKSRQFSFLEMFQKYTDNDFIQLMYMNVFF